MSVNRSSSGGVPSRTPVESGSAKARHDARAGRSTAARRGAPSEVKATIEGEVMHIEVRLAGRPGDDPLAAAKELFADELRGLLGDALPDPGAVRRAARLAFAEQAWEQRLGELWETRDVVRALGLSRQRVHALANDHRLIALPHQGRLRYPVWQFAAEDAAGRTTLARAHRLLVEQGGVDPWSAAAWFLTAHPELDSVDPLEWIRGGGDPERLLTVARRDAARAAQ